MVFLSCEKPVNTPFYLDTSTCNDNGYYSSNSSISRSKRYKYVTIGTISAKDARDSCKVEMLFMTSWPGNDNPIISCTEVLNKLVYGFELSRNRFICESQCGRGRSCYFDNLNLVQCNSGKIGLGEKLYIFFLGWILSLYYLFTERRSLELLFVYHSRIAYYYLYLLLNIAGKIQDDDRILYT
nr:uncharacterized protein LOC112031201 [Quercus suber]